MIAKLLVPAGASDQERAGEMLLPVQPMPLKMWAAGIVLPACTSELVRVNFAAGFWAEAPEKAAAAMTTAVVRGLNMRGLCGRKRSVMGARMLAYIIPIFGGK